MQAVTETVFDIVYLSTVVVLGFKMLSNRGGEKQFFLYGIMALILGFGDAFHLVPRAVALCTTGLDDYTRALGIGKWITSVTMTVFYVLLYYAWRLRYNIGGGKVLTSFVYLLAAVRIALCFMPQNAWTEPDAPLSWALYRNIPFVILGLLIIILFYYSARKTRDIAFRWLWLTVVLSFGFYIPVVFWSSSIPLIGMLMIPKTCAYVWTIYIGYADMRRKKR